MGNVISFTKIMKEAEKSSHLIHEDIWEWVHGWKNEETGYMNRHIPSCERCGKEAQRIMDLDKKLGIES